MTPRRPAPGEVDLEVADGPAMCKFLDELAEALTEAGPDTAEDLADYYGFSGALTWIIGMLQEYAANPPLRCPKQPAAAP